MTAIVSHRMNFTLTYRQLFLVALAYSILTGLLMQLWVIPVTGLGGNVRGLLAGDSHVFHQQAIRIISELDPAAFVPSLGDLSFGAAGNVWLLAVIYKYFGVDPLYFIPINSLVHSLSVVLVLKITRENISVFHLSPLQAAISYTPALFALISPTNQIWLSQNGKDAFVIFGILLTCYGYSRLLKCEYLKGWAISLASIGAGVLVVHFMRPHLVLLIGTCLLIYHMSIGTFYLVNRRRELSTQFRGCVGALMICTIPAITPVYFNSIPAGTAALSEFAERNSVHSKDSYVWRGSEYIPRALDERLSYVSALRYYFTQYSLDKRALLFRNSDQHPRDFSELMSLTPNILISIWTVGLEGVIGSNSAFGRLVYTFESLATILILIGLVKYFTDSSANHYGYSLLFLGIIISCLFAYVNPSIGTFIRIRFPFLLIFMIFAAIGYISKLERQMLIPAKSLSSSR